MHVGDISIELKSIELKYMKVSATMKIGKKMTENKIDIKIKVILGNYIICQE
jgi:hypothetical protein